MNAVVLYKWGRDPDETFVYDDGSTKVLRDRLVSSDDDAAAIVCAREWAQAQSADLTAVTIGNGDVAWAAARGAARSVSAGELMPSVDETVTAEALANAARAAGSADLVVMGDARDTAGVAGAFAALLGLPLVAGVQDFAADPDDSRYVIAHRKADKVIETLRVALPAVIAVAAVEQEKNVPSIKQMLAAKKAPVESVSGASVREAAVSRTGQRCPELHRATIFGDEASQAAAELVAALRADDAL